MMRFWPQAQERDRGSLPVAILLTMVAAGMSIVLLGTSTRMVVNTRVEAARDAALDAARTGLATALAGLRTSIDATTGLGKVSALPCGTTGVPQIVGTLASNVAGYKTTISYLSLNPIGQSTSWLATNGRACTSVIPKFAYLLSVGTAANGITRTLFGTYAFKSMITANTPGGAIHVLRTDTSTQTDLCMDAGLTPAAGTRVRMQLCATNPDGSAVDRQKFAYNPNVTISLTTANTTSYPTGLCLDSGSPEAVKAIVRLQACGSTTLPQQQWSFDSSSSLFGTSDGSTLNSFCISMATPNTAGSSLQLNDTSGGLGNGNNNCGTVNTNYQNWSPDPAVGSGGSQLPVTHQLVNYGEFGRCLDVTGQALWAPYMLAFPCQQTPDPTVRPWNQQWYFTVGATQVMVQKPGESATCLYMNDVTANPIYTSLGNCSENSPKQAFIYRGRDAPSYDEAYRLEGTGTLAGYCLQPMEDVASGWSQAYRVGMRPCTGSKLQKWNAAPASTQSDYTAIGER